MQNLTLKSFVALLLLASILPSEAIAATTPKVGEKAPDFALNTLEDKPVRLSELNSQNKVVLVVLRGWPGYQCPLCTAQVNEFVSSAGMFAETKTKVLMVYPGPANDLRAHAQEFLSNKNWAKDFTFVIDPEFSMVNQYGLRWDMPGETAYPSTFVLEPGGAIKFAKVSHSHGNRSKPGELLPYLK